MTISNTQHTLLLRNARVVLPRMIAEGASVLVEDGRIAFVGKNVEAEHAIDLRNHTLYPGFIDLHIHGAVGVDTNSASVTDLSRVSAFLAEHGVTSWLPTLVPGSETEYSSATRAIGELISLGDENMGARALGVHYEGPFVSEAQCGALRTEFFRRYTSVSDISFLPRVEQPHSIHLMTLAPEIEGGIELVRELKERGWIISIGHTRASIDDLDRACEAGARHVTHFMNAMPPLHHREPGPIGWGLLRDEVTCDVIADGVHSDPLMLKLVAKCKGIDRVALISDAVAPTGLGDGEFQIWNETIQVENGRTRNARGSIAGSVITMLDAVRMMLSIGFSEVEVTRMASLVPARVLGISHDCGTIEEGKRADLVALSERGEVSMTMVGGRVVFDRRAP